MPLPPQSLKAYSVDPKKDTPPLRESGHYAPAESAKIDEYIVIRGHQASELGRSAWAIRDIPKGEVFTCTRVRMYLRHVKDGAPNIWAIRVTAHATKEAVCNSLNWEIPTKENGLALWTGPPRAGKASSHGYSYKETTPPMRSNSGEGVPNKLQQG